MKTNVLYYLIGLLISTCHISTNAQTDANIPIQGITIYIDYPDAPASVSSDQLDSIINGETYTELDIERSFKNYWHQQSRRNVVINHDIFFYSAPNPVSYYEALPWYEGILLWQNALEHIIAAYPGYDWDLLSESESGSLRSIMIISSAWGPAGVGAAHYPNWILSNGKKVGSIYGSVLQAPWDLAHNLFMTTHEGGHGIFGFPDTYDTEYNSGGTSFYTLMSGGKPDIEPIGGPFLAQNNWGYVLNPTPGTQIITLKADGDSIVTIRNPHDPFEFFTIEARKQSNIGNSRFPVELGLLIWHTDSKVFTSNTREEMTPLLHYKHSIEQADGLFELENDIDIVIGGNAGDIFVPGSVFTNSSTPNANWWSGEQSNITIENIEFVGTDFIRFTVTIPEIHEDHYPEINQDGWTLISATPPQVGYEGDKAFDGDITTYYHVPWGNTEPRSHDLIIDLNDLYTINEIYYTANSNTSPPWEGRIENYEIYMSEDGIEWGVPVATGTFFRTEIRQYILIPETIGRYLKFAAINSFDDDVRTSIAEINLRGYRTSEAGLIENEPLQAISIYPNPATDILHVYTKQNDNYNLEVYNLAGALILNTSFNQETTIDLSEFNQGVYLIKFSSANNSETYRFVKV